MSTLSTECIEWESTGRYLSVLGHRIFTIDVGEPAAPEDTLLLLHGFPESSFSYHLVLPTLQKHFSRIVLVDFVGFGLSDKPIEHEYSLNEQADVLLSVWHQLGIRGGHLLAHDMGDSVATELLARIEFQEDIPFSPLFPSITCTNGNMVMELAKLRILQSLLLKPFLGAFLSRCSTYRMFRHQVNSASGGSTLSNRDVELMWELVTHNGGHRIGYRLIRYLNERHQYQNSRWLPAIQQTSIPFHICWGTADRVAPLAVARHLKKSICPAATVTLLEGVGHFAQQENPTAWLQSVLDFWEKG